MGHLKSYVRNKAQPEGSIAEGYLAEEVLTFCSQYMEGMKTRTNRPSRVDDSFNTNISELNTIFPPIGVKFYLFSIKITSVKNVTTYVYYGVRIFFNHCKLRQL